MAGPFKNYQAIFKQFDSEHRAIVLLNLLNQQHEMSVVLVLCILFLSGGYGLNNTKAHATTGKGRGTLWR
jgi:hypothetical protein